jgi:hypothetical protein
MKQIKSWIKAGLMAIAVLFAIAVGLAIYARSLPPVHQHCIKAAGFALMSYAADHAGAYPVHTNGFGDAIALLVAEEYDDGRHFVGVGDDATWLRAAVTNKADVHEELCTRIYVQGLNESQYGLAVLFDRYAVRGGDHHREMRGQPYLREVLMADGSMNTITLDRWPSFASNQVQLLVQAGIPRATAEAYYRPTLDPNAKR